MREAQEIVFTTRRLFSILMAKNLDFCLDSNDACLDSILLCNLLYISLSKSSREREMAKNED